MFKVIETIKNLFSRSDGPQIGITLSVIVILIEHENNLKQLWKNNRIIFIAYLEY